MSKVLEGVTLETFPEVVKQCRIQPGQRFAIVLEADQQPERPKLTDIAAKMRATAVTRGMTTEIFDAILAET